MNFGMRVRGGLLAALMMFALPVAATLAVMLVCSSAVAQTVDSIQVEGNRRVEIETIRSYFKAGPGGRLEQAQIENYVRRSVLKSMRSVIRGEQKEIQRLLQSLRVAVGTDLDMMMRELRSRSLQTESSLAAKLDDIDASLSLIARELARRADDPPSSVANRAP